jgi:hypothetical protein
MVVKTPSLPPPSTAATVDNATIGAIKSIPSLPPSTTTTIAAIDGHHCRCHTVNDNDRQKQAVIVCHRRRQRRSSLTEAAADGNLGNGGLYQRQSLLMEAAVV